VAAKQVSAVTGAARRRRWIVWGSVSGGLFLSLFHRVAPAVIADRLMVDFGVTASAVGALSAIYFYVYVAMQIPAGLLVDSLGSQRTGAAGSLVVALGASLFALAPNLPAAFAGRFLVGLGASVAFVCLLKVITVWFRPTEFATLAGFGTVVSTAGAAAAATPLAAATEAFGWRAAIAVGAAANLGVAALIWRQVDDPLPDEAVGEAPSVPVRRAATVWRNPQTWLCFAAHFGWFGAYLTFVGLWGVPYLMHVHRFDRVGAANLMIGVSVAYTAAALGLGILSDRWCRRKAPMIAAGAVFLAAWLVIVLWPGGRPPTVVTVPAVMIACAAAAPNLLCLALAKESNPPEAAGLAMASANGGILCAAVLQPLIGAALDFAWRGEVVGGARVYGPAAYQLGFAAFIVFGVVALGAALLTRESHCRNIWPVTPPR
jgi:predicted MFS family arabinose efflux permease